MTCISGGFVAFVADCLVGDSDYYPHVHETGVYGNRWGGIVMRGIVISRRKMSDGTKILPRIGKRRPQDS